jgi:hypothetical protein
LEKETTMTYTEGLSGEVESRKSLQGLALQTWFLFPDFSAVPFEPAGDVRQVRFFFHNAKHE